MFEKFVSNVWPASISLSQGLSGDCLPYSMLPLISWLMGQGAGAGCPRVICVPSSVQNSTRDTKLDMERFGHIEQHVKPNTCFMFSCVPAHGKDTYMNHCHSLLRLRAIPMRLWRTRSWGVVVKLTWLYQPEPLKNLNYSKCNLRGSTCSAWMIDLTVLRAISSTSLANLPSYW